MTKVNITKKTGETETLNVLCAFKAEGNTYIIFDSEKLGSMGLPIIYVSKYTDKLEKINDANEWQSAKNYIKGIINGTNYEFVALDENVTSDEVFYTPLTLPQASFDTIKNRYVVPQKVEVSPAVEENNILEVEPNILNMENVNNVEANVDPVTRAIPVIEPIANISPVSEPMIDNQRVPEVNEPVNPEVIPHITPLTPPVVEQAIPNVVPQVEPNINVASPIVPQNIPTVETVPNVEPTLEVVPPVNLTQDIVPPVVETSVKETPIIDLNAIDFNNDKETFLKACENMFDALISKYQKELSELEKREQVVAQKEAEINAKMQNAKEALANAEAREQVANIAHDNAQKVMDLSSLMPKPEDAGIQAGVL